MAALAFPLNVYAWSLFKEHGQLCQLHYGVFDSPQMPVLQAQQKAGSLLIELLPAPCQILEVDIGLGTMLATLAHLGHHVTGIAPSDQQAALARQLHGDQLPALTGDFKNFSQDPGGWDAIVFQQSSQHINGLDLFVKASALLKDSGEIIIADEFALTRTEPGKEDLHHLDYFLALADRFGFECQDRRDVGPQVAPSIGHLIQAVTRRTDQISQELGIPRDRLDALVQADRRRREKYAVGRFGYVFLKLKRKSKPVWNLNWVGPSNAIEMRQLFHEVFGHELSEALWQWKYGDGLGHAVGVWEGGKLIAHYGGITRPILFFGKPDKACQSCDVIALSPVRKALSRRSPFFLAAATYIEEVVGYGTPHLLGFGFPSKRHRRAAELLGFYDIQLGKILEISWALRHSPLSALFVRTRRLDLSSQADRDLLDASWAAMQAASSDQIIGVKDAAWCAHRYAGHPERQYQLYAVISRMRGTVDGVIVLHQQDAHHRFELMDVVGAPHRIKGLVSAARRIAKRQGASLLTAWVSDAILKWFGNPDQIQDPEIGIPSNLWTQGPPSEELVGKWWLMGGDADFK